MLDYSTIRDNVTRRTNEAIRLHKKPFLVNADLVRALSSGRVPDRSIPFLGYYCPTGWEETEVTYFVDSSGYGSENEPALTLREFGRELFPYETGGYGIGVIESGEFQVIVRLYRRIK